jgi:hypothetical protein
MISDQARIEQLARAWAGVRKWQSLFKSRAAVSFIGSIGLAGAYDEYYSVLLIVALSVLEDVLTAAKDEGAFTGARSSLGALMHDSKAAGIAWRDFGAADAAREQRNKLAHERVIPSKDATFGALDAIESELIGWAILSGPVSHDAGSSVQRSS